MRIRSVLMPALLAFLALTAPPAAAAPTAAELLGRVDDNEVYKTIAYDGEMVVEYRGKRFAKTLVAKARGRDEFYVEFTNPEDRGTKYLKREGRLYVYSPDAEEVMLISGHLLKESMMGSDMSYEDTIDNERLSARYEGSLAGKEIVAGRDGVAGREAWILDLAAKRKTESYPKRRLWIDVETEDLLRYELFALSGAKLKEYTLLKAERIGERRFPVESEMRDLLRKGSRTVFKMSNLVLDAPVPDSTFGMRNLER